MGVPNEIYLTMVGLIKNDRNNIIGFRVVDPKDITDAQVKDITYESMITFLKSNNQSVFMSNLAIEFGKLVCTNGSFEKYGTVGKSSVPVVIRQYNDKSGNKLGFAISDTQGIVSKKSEAKLVEIAEVYGLANGKIVPRDGVKIISSLVGSYPIVEVEPIRVENKQPVQTQAKPVAQPAPQQRANSRPELMKSPEELGFEFKLINVKGSEFYIAGIEPKTYSGHVIIPTEYKGKKISGIAAEAFKESYISEVYVGPSVTDIGREAFISCQNLSLVDLSAARNTNIAIGTFKHCSRLSEVNLGKHVIRIHDRAFEACRSLREFSLPDSVEEIAYSAFSGCSRLVEVKSNGKLKRVNESAFRDCSRLEKFNFSGLEYIGANAFDGTNFTSLVIYGTTKLVGMRAFKNNRRLTNVIILDGVVEIGSGCFSSEEKTSKSIEQITIAKSVITFGNGSLANIKLAKVYYGSSAESHCIGFSIPIEYIDELSKDNSTRARMMNRNMGLKDADMIKIIHDALNTDISELKYDYEIDETKLIQFKMPEEFHSMLKVKKSESYQPPSIQFKGAVNYITSVAKYNQTPLTTPVLRMIDTMNVENNYIYDDGCNKICQIEYINRDNQQSGRFIVIIMRNEIRFVTPYNSRLNIQFGERFTGKYSVPTAFLHAGDTVGKDSTISGAPAKLEINHNVINVGAMLLERMENEALFLKTGIHSRAYISMHDDSVVAAVDQRVWDKPEQIKKDTPDHINITAVSSSKEFIKNLQALKISDDDTDFFNEIANYSKEYVDYKTESLRYIGVETVNPLWLLAKKFKERTNGRTYNTVEVTDLTTDLFIELSKSYWMVEKDTDWLNATGKKALNRTNEYTLDNCKVIEYRSNQVVKFSNPYMKGCKGAYIFVMAVGNSIRGVYASNRSLLATVKSIFAIGDYSLDGYEAPELFKDPAEVDKVPPKLFYHFYDVLYSKKGWQFGTISYYSSGSNAQFNISMYKPTGVFYLTMSSVEYDQTERVVGNKKEIEYTAKFLKTVPLFKIGDVDRALLVADTTNSNSRKSQIKSQLIALAFAHNRIAMKRRLTGIKTDDGVNVEEMWNRYLKARELTINGVRLASEYSSLIDDRLTLMIGACDKTGPKLYHSFEFDANRMFINNTAKAKDDWDSQVLEEYEEEPEIEDDDWDDEESEPTEEELEASDVDSDDWDDEEEETEDEEEETVEVDYSLYADLLRTVGADADKLKNGEYTAEEIQEFIARLQNR